VKHPARWVAVTAAVVVTGFSIVLATQVGSDPSADAKTSQLFGKALPAFSVRALDGSKVTQRDLSGRAVIVNFWNSWCIPCQDELPALQDFYARHADDPTFFMLGIVRDDTERAVRRYVQAQGISWTIGLDPSSEASLAFGTRGQPETYAISPDGTVVAYQFGQATVKDLEAMLARAQAGAR
jgi:cytochrome c biogenesis protein CcmG/thiol:disulfide interchange protein DsbE